MVLKTLDDVNVKGKLILLRVDINSPVIKGKILDNPRFEASAKTIRELLDKKARVVILAHQGRKGSKDFLKLKQHAILLSRYTKSNVRYLPYLFGEKAKIEIKALKPGEAILLENVRAFLEEGKTNSIKYKTFCSSFDIYINDAFSVSHRKQGSIIIPPKYLPSYMGRQFQKEIEVLSRIDNKLTKKVFILGGEKLEDYFPIFEYLNHKKNKLLAGGVLGNAFLSASGINLGLETKWLKRKGYNKFYPRLKNILKRYSKQIIFPIDFGLLAESNKRINVTLNEAPYKHKIFDIGSETFNLFKKNISEADFIFMKGPLGFSEYPKFSKGTIEILKCISRLTLRKKIFSLIGGGHLTTTLERYHIRGKFSHISLSGGALLEYISGKKLPGLEMLK